MSDDVLEAGGTIAGKYEIHSTIGRGGFSQVYRGVHRAMNRTVAIKIFDPASHGSDSPDRTAWRAERFEREARLVSRLRHPNTVTIFDYGLEPDGRAYLVMEYIEGRTLDSVIRREGPLGRERTVTIFLQVLASLEEAHHLEILHRDLKPANIMLTTNFKGQEIAKVLDFGIARMLRDRPAKDKKGRLFLGTPRYAAPEQLAMRQLSLATDIYCVGTLLWECIVGSPMVPTGDVRECIRLAAHPDPWRVPANADVDPDLQTIIETAVAKNPAHRYQNAAQMIEALEGCTSIVRSELPDIRPTSPFAAGDDIADPNLLEADEADSYFLTPEKPASPPPAPYAALRQSDPSRLPPSHREPRRRQSRAQSKAPSPSGPRRKSSSSTSSTSRPSSRPSPAEPSISPTISDDPNPVAARPPSSQLQPPTDDRVHDPYADEDRRQTIIFAVVAIVMALGGIVAVAALWIGSSGDDEVPSPTISAVDDGDDEEVIEEFEPPAAFDDLLFSIESIALAMERFEWDVERGVAIRHAGDYAYEHIRISLEGDVVDLHVYDVDSPDVMAELVRETSPPDRYVLLGNLYLRLHADDDESADRATGHLEQFRDLVLERAGH